MLNSWLTLICTILVLGIFIDALLARELLYALGLLFGSGAMIAKVLTEI